MLYMTDIYSVACTSPDLLTSGQFLILRSLLSVLKSDECALGSTVKFDRGFRASY